MALSSLFYNAKLARLKACDINLPGMWRKNENNPDDDTETARETTSHNLKKRRIRYVTLKHITVCQKKPILPAMDTCAQKTVFFAPDRLFCQENLFQRSALIIF